MPYRRASVTHIRHNVAKPCKDALPGAVGDDRCDGLNGTIVNEHIVVAGGEQIYIYGNVSRLKHIFSKMCI